MPDFTKMSLHTLTTGVDSSGVRHLELFLKEYKSIFSGTVNPGCSKCLTTYLDRYKKYKMKKKSENTSGYKLKKKYQNIPLEFGSPILVNNDNITEEYAKKLLKKKNGADLFEEMPEPKNEQKATEVIDEINATKNLADLEKYASDTRKTVIKAYNEKKEELIKASDVLSEDVQPEPKNEQKENTGDGQEQNENE